MTTTIRRIKPSELSDEHTISKIMDGRFTKTETYCWDEGFGPLYAYVESLGILGYVRARTWEEAFLCAQDEIMHDGEEADAIEGLTPEQIDNGDLNEGYGYRSSGEPSNPNRHSHLYSEDLNGSALTEVTDQYAEDHGIEIYIEDEDGAN
jgi:hypothetical protein